MLYSILYHAKEITANQNTWKQLCIQRYYTQPSNRVYFLWHSIKYKGSCAYREVTSASWDFPWYTCTLKNIASLVCIVLCKIYLAKTVMFNTGFRSQQWHDMFSHRQMWLWLKQSMLTLNLVRTSKNVGMTITNIPLTLAWKKRESQFAFWKSISNFVCPGQVLGLPGSLPTSENENLLSLA